MKSPESQGLSSPAVLRWVEAIEQNVKELHGFVLMRHGEVVAEGWWKPYAPEYPHMLFSLSKSFTSTAVGMAVSEGFFSVEDPVIKFFPEDLPKKLSANLRAMQVKHLLAMCTGHAFDTTRFLFMAKDGSWPRAFLKLAVEFEPGTHFLYNTGATYMLSAIVQKTTGKTLVEFLTPRLFEPLGIQNPTWETDPRGVNTGGFGLNITTRDIAAFGQLYLQKGMWQGRRLIDEAWVSAATSKQINNGDNPDSDWNQGYGYQFWRCRHNAYRGDGAFGQYCVVMPDQDAVLAITAGLGDMQQPLNFVWEHLLGQMQDSALPEDPAALETLRQKLASLEYAPPGGSAKPMKLMQQVSGCAYAFKKNRMEITSARFDFAPDGSCVFTAADARGEHHVDIGAGEWKLGQTTLFERPGVTAASGGWVDRRTYQALIRAYETTFTYTLTAVFSAGKVKITTQQNVGFMEPKPLKMFGEQA